ncbi:MAG: AmmeMemoRadiSam system protein A [Oscillospiraceae bacterium]|nr:AmmeMemoRadiSam system protein A [Oscillospiraceae bacterium]
MSIVGAIIVPHPPVIIPEVGKGREKEIQNTIDAYRKAAQRVASWQPETLILSSPHAMMYGDYNHISPGKGAEGDLADFGASGVKIKVDYDVELRDELTKSLSEAGVPAGVLGDKKPRLDHGSLIPLYFLREAGVNCPILRIGLSGLPAIKHYELGCRIAEAVEKVGRRAAYIASGDLSHKLKSDGPYGFSPEGPEYDRQIEEIMSTGDFSRLLTMNAGFCDKAAECGQRSFQIMAGALDGLSVTPELLSHEGPFGVGYGVAVFTVNGKDGSRRFGEAFNKAERERMEARKAGEDEYVRLARLSLETFVNTGKRLDKLPENLPKTMLDTRAGAFVSLHKDGQLRGCIGTIAPTTGSVAEEIVQNAVSACANDPRFYPVLKSELEDLEYSVDVLGQAEDISSKAELDVHKYGVIVTCGSKRGLLLPDLEGVDTIDEQVAIAMRKGGIREGEKYSLQRFRVVRHR